MNSVPRIIKIINSKVNKEWGLGFKLEEQPLWSPESGAMW